MYFTRFFFINLYTPIPTAHTRAAPNTPPMIVEPDMIPDVSSCAEKDAAAAAAARTGRKSVAVLLAVAVALTDAEPDPENDPDELLDGDADDDGVTFEVPDTD